MGYRAGGLIAVTLLTFLSACPAFADAPDDDVRARADAEFAEGKALLDKGLTAAACVKFARSQELDPKLGRLLNLAFCHEQEGKTASAWNEYNAAAALAEQKGQPERVDFAREHATAVAKRLSFLHLVVPAGAESVQVDGGGVPRERWPMPQPLDPGPHKVVVTAAGKRTERISVTLPSDPGIKEVPIPALEDESPAASGAREPAEPAEPARPETHGSRVPAYVVGGVALAGFGVGSVAGLQAIAKRSEADLRCQHKQCDPTGSALISDAKTAATVSTIGFGVGLAGAAAAIWLFVRSSHGEPAVTRWTPLVGPRTAGVTLEGAW
jgi:hypothetical protein